MSIPVVEPISRAFGHVERICFKPFDFSKWVGLGFCMFLAHLGEGGFNLPTQWANRGKDMGGELQTAQAWVQEHLTLVITIGIAVVVVGLLIGLLLTWLSSRGQFMVLLNAIRNQGEVGSTWRESREPGNRLFVFRFVVGLLSLLVVILPIALSIWHAWPSIQAETFDGRAAVALFGGCGVTGLLMLFLLAFHAVVNHFVVPVMWKTQAGPVEALRLFWYDLLPGRMGSLIGFLLMLIPLQMGAGIITMLGVCLTCCLGALPVVSSILFLPVSLFFRCYALEFLAGFGPEWNLFATPEAPAEIPAENP